MDDATPDLAAELLVAAEYLESLPMSRKARRGAVAVRRAIEAFAGRSKETKTGGPARAHSRHDDPDLFKEGLSYAFT